MLKSVKNQHFTDNQKMNQRLTIVAIVDFFVETTYLDAKGKEIP